MPSKESKSPAAIYKGDFVDIERIKLAAPKSLRANTHPPRDAIPPPEDDGFNWDNGRLAPDIEITDGDLEGLLEDDGWLPDTEEQRDPLIRELAIQTFEDEGIEPPVELVKRPRFADGEYPRKKPFMTAEDALRYAQVRDPNGPPRIQAATIAAVAMPSKRVKLQHRGELDQDMFGWLRMHRNRKTWRSEVAGGDYTRFTAHVPIPSELDAESKSGQTQLAVRSAFLALQKNTTITFKKKREAHELYRGFIGKTTTLPVQEDRNITVNFDKLVDIILAEETVPERLNTITEVRQKSIAAPSK